MRRALAVAVVLAAAPAHADHAADRARVEKLFQLANRAYKAQSFATAAQQLEEALKVMALPELAFSAAQAYRRAYYVDPSLPLARRAVELYRMYLDKVKHGGRVRDAADYIGEMQREVDKLAAAGAKAAAAVRVERTTIVINPELGTERDAAVREIVDLPGTTDPRIVATLDGKGVPVYEMIDVAPGPHAIRVEAEGYLPKELTARAVKGAPAIADVVMTPRPARITLATDAGARIRVDGRPAQLAKDASLELPAGHHMITLSRAGRETVAREVTLARGQQLAMREPLAKTLRRRAVPWVGIAAAGLAVLSGGSAIAALVEDGRAADRLAAIRGGDQTAAAAADYDRRVTRRGQLTTAAWATGAAALVVGAAAAVLYWEF